MMPRIIWDNSGDGSAVRAVAEKVDGLYRVEMRCSGRYSVTYGASLRRAWFRGLSFMLTGSYDNLAHRAVR